MMKTSLVLFFLGTVLTGCAAGYSRTEISSVSSNELSAEVTPTHITVTHGGVVTAHIAPFNSDSNPMVGDVASDDRTILDVQRAYGDKNYAFLGVKPGKTIIEFKADGVTVARVESDVVEQTPQ